MNVTMAEERREVGVAEKMMMGKNYVAAREKLIKALQSSPPTEIANQMMIVCDILSAASIKFPNFGIDYYWVLQLSPMCSQSDVNYRYNKLLKALQPSRYKIHGAQLAGKLVKDAFSVLSNPSQRGAYDLRRADTREGYRSFSVPTAVYYGISDLMTQPTLQSFSVSSSNVNVLESDVQNQAPSQASDNLSSRETVEAGLNKSADISNQALDSDPSQSSKSLDVCSNQDFFDFEKHKQNQKFEVGEIWASGHHTKDSNGCRYARVDSNSNTDSSLTVTWLKPTPISSGERNWCEAGLPVACGSFEVDSTMRGLESWPMIFAYKCSWLRSLSDEHYEIYPQKGEVWAVYKNWDLDRMADSPDDLNQYGFDLIEMLSNFSKYLGGDASYLSKVDAFKNIFVQKLNEEERDIEVAHIHPKNIFMFSHRVPSYRFEGGEIDGAVNGMIELDHSALVTENSEPDLKHEELDAEDSKSLSFTHTELPAQLNTYSEYQCLSPSWSQYDFCSGQVWAVFCSDDYMPRKYTLVESLISDNQVSVSLLDPLWSADDANITAYGIYQVSEFRTVVDISRFSHLVKCRKSTNKPIYKILPRKGEVWAMYENWNGGWKSSDYSTSKYRVVEIVNEYGEGFTVAKLEEVKGCLTFYVREKHDGFNLTDVVMMSEYLRFSHQIPAYKVPGIGAYGVPEEAWHLDPSALPPKM